MANIYSLLDFFLFINSLSTTSSAHWTPWRWRKMARRRGDVRQLVWGFCSKTGSRLEQEYQYTRVACCSPISSSSSSSWGLVGGSSARRAGRQARWRSRAAGRLTGLPALEWPPPQSPLLLLLRFPPPAPPYLGSGGPEIGTTSRQNEFKIRGL